MHRRNLRYGCMRSRQEESKKGGLVRIKNYIGEVSGENVRDVWWGKVTDSFLCHGYYLELNLLGKG